MYTAVIFFTQLSSCFFLLDLRHWLVQWLSRDPCLLSWPESTRSKDVPGQTTLVIFGAFLASLKSACVTWICKEDLEFHIYLEKYITLGTLYVFTHSFGNIVIFINPINKSHCIRLRSDTTCSFESFSISRRSIIFFFYLNAVTCRPPSPALWILRKF